MAFKRLEELLKRLRGAMGVDTALGLSSNLLDTRRKNEAAQGKALADPGAPLAIQLREYPPAIPGFPDFRKATLVALPRPLPPTIHPHDAATWAAAVWRGRAAGGGTAAATGEDMTAGAAAPAVAPPLRTTAAGADTVTPRSRSTSPHP